jgi:hypothetical protein
MTSEDTPVPDGPLQFDRVEAAMSHAEGSAQPGVTCRSCNTVVKTQYFLLGGATLCASCAATVDAVKQASQRGSAFVRAAVFGVGAMVAGAILYYAVVKVTKLEIGLVAIAIGYMVGYAVRRGSRGWGGLRYQVLAAFLTYYAVGLAYMPLAFGGSPKTETVATPGLAAIGILFGLSFALPVLAAIESGPSGLISLAIVAFGMQQAWRMTARPPVDLAGPYQVGRDAAPA